MGNLTVKEKSIKTKADYEDESLKIDVNITEDATTNTLQSLNGSIYHKDDSTYAGNFDGNLHDGEIEYSMSSVKSKDMSAVINALADIESQIRENEEPVDYDLPDGDA